MKFDLVNKKTKEIISTATFKMDSIAVAEHYFIHTKRLQPRQFNKLFKVKKHEE